MSVLTNKDRKYRDICTDFKNLSERGARLEIVCSTLGWKYYMNPDTIYKIYQENNAKYFLGFQCTQQAQTLIEAQGQGLAV